MIVIGSYDDWNLNGANVASISEDGGKKVDFQGIVLKELCPSKELMELWNKYSGGCSLEMSEKIFTIKYYKDVLSKLDPIEVYNKINERVLLDYQNVPTRNVLCAWLELLLGLPINGVFNYDIEYYLLDEADNENIRQCLEDVMKKNSRMLGFHSLQALYLYNQSLKTESDANRQKDPEEYAKLMQSASFLRCDADEAEEKYLAGQKAVIVEKADILDGVYGYEFWCEEQGYCLATNRSKPFILKKMHKQIDGQTVLNNWQG